MVCWGTASRRMEANLEAEVAMQLCASCRTFTANYIGSTSFWDMFTTWNVSIRLQLIILAEHMNIDSDQTNRYSFIFFSYVQPHTENIHAMNC
ncbi:hypothetical protein PVAP13_8KG251229 [Panicum virgatum]|uniref:Uncharacterized protein n=1 Tax=Panicum virgatum TaxID=38727 RepID=A0A8T0PKC8_PANVG|nr:hypothetical protein PVAP13_8KG251229 [Panicum virgatum]